MCLRLDRSGRVNSAPPCPARQVLWFDKRVMWLTQPDAAGELIAQTSLTPLLSVVYKECAVCSFTSSDR